MMFNIALQFGKTYVVPLNLLALIYKSLYCIQSSVGIFWVGVVL